MQKLSGCGLNCSKGFLSLRYDCQRLKKSECLALLEICTPKKVWPISYSTEITGCVPVKHESGGKFEPPCIIAVQELLKSAIACKKPPVANDAQQRRRVPATGLNRSHISELEQKSVALAEISVVAHKSCSVCYARKQHNVHLQWKFLRHIKRRAARSNPPTCSSSFTSRPRISHCTTSAAA